MLASLTGSSCRRNTKEVFSHALAEPAVTWGRSGKKYISLSQRKNVTFVPSLWTYIPLEEFAELMKWTLTNNWSICTLTVHRMSVQWHKLATITHKENNKNKLCTLLYLPKSINCFIDRGDGENLENLSTCLGIPATKLFFNKSWANFIFPPLWRPQLYQKQKALSFFSAVSASSASYLLLASMKLFVGFSSSAFAFLKAALCPSNSASMLSEVLLSFGVGGSREWHPEQPIRARVVLPVGGVASIASDAKRALRVSPTDGCSELPPWFKLLDAYRNKSIHYIHIFEWSHKAFNLFTC